MSILVERVLHEIDRLTLIEQMQVLEHLAKQMKRSVESVNTPTNGLTAKPKYKVSDFCGIAPNLLEGMDAQVWVNQLRDEWEDREVWRQSP